MSNNPNERTFKTLKIAIMTVSDTRTEADDKSGDARVRLLTGAIKVLFDKGIKDFGEVFRAESYDEVGTSIIQARAQGGVANATFIFCLPGSTGACRTGWEKIINHQLDYRTRPCNLVELMPRVLE